MAWQGDEDAGGAGGAPGEPDDATRADWPAVAPQPGASLPPAASPNPPPPGPPAAPPPVAPAPVPPVTPWAPADQAGSWATPPAAGGAFAVPGAPGLVYAGALPRAAAYLVDVVLVGIVASIVAGPFTESRPLVEGAAFDGQRLLMTNTGVSTMVSVVIGAAYFILLWTTSGRATLGMRLFSLQVGDAASGAKLRFDQAFKRWLAYGSWLGLLGFALPLAAIVGLVELAWFVVLLVSTVSSPTKQGIHDRFAGSAMVRPATAGNGLALTCLVVFLLLPVIAVISIVALILLGGQVSSILSAVGDSI